jgi:hypothetical protein
MNKLEERIDELECQNEELRDLISDLESRFEVFAKPCAIGQDQLWEVLQYEFEKGNIETYIPAGGIELKDLI